MSRTSRSTEATTRAYSTRKISPTCSCTPTSYARVSHLPDGPHVHDAAVADGHLLRPLQRLLARGALQQIEAAERLFRLGERTVGDLMVARLHAEAAGLGLRTQPLGHDRLAGLARRFAEPHEGLQPGLALGRGGLGPRLGVVSDQEQVAHNASSHSGCRGPFTSTTPTAPSNRQPETRAPLARHRHARRAGHDRE